MAEECGVLAVERALGCQFIDARQQLRAGDRRFGAGVFSPGFIDRLGHRRFVLAQLLQSPLEVGIGISWAGQRGWRRGEPKISLMIIKPSQASPIPRRLRQDLSELIKD